MEDECRNANEPNLEWTQKQKSVERDSNSKNFQKDWNSLMKNGTKLQNWMPVNGQREPRKESTGGNVQ
jgi:hypothetical protein